MWGVGMRVLDRYGQRLEFCEGRLAAGCLPGCTPSLRFSTKNSHMPGSGLRTPQPSLPVAYMIVAGTSICTAAAASQSRAISVLQPHQPQRCGPWTECLALAAVLFGYCVASRGERSMEALFGIGCTFSKACSALSLSFTDCFPSSCDAMPP